MSCETNSNKASNGASRSGGIHQLQSKAAAVSAAMANRVLNTIDRDGAGAKMARNPVIGTADSVVRYAPHVVRSAAIGGLLGSAVASAGPAGMIALAGSLAAACGLTLYRQRLRADKRNGPVEEIDLPVQSGQAKGADDSQESKVQIWPMQGDPTGVVFQMAHDSTNWEKRRRTGGNQPLITLKTARRSGPEYYFQGELSNADAVKIASGAAKPYRLPGYLGTVSEKEKLSPLWALSKRGMIMLSGRGNSL